MAVLKEADPIASQQFWNLCKWTNKEQEIKEQYSVLLGGSPTAVLEAMLFLTALIEHSLGKKHLLTSHEVIGQNFRHDSSTESGRDVVCPKMFATLAITFHPEFCSDTWFSLSMMAVLTDPEACFRFPSIL
uniref:Uncharacterized protein n=1 Tax=Timema douglasi TaxID=61478 RepID=A0A7R8ZHA2_TIMDO|nr:unnamed protein product [Timema douglasi]